jgi:hypothetical protein
MNHRCAVSCVLRSLYLGVFLSFATTHSSEGAEPARDCSPDEAIRAEEATDHLNAWHDVYSFYKQYRQCNDGAIAEGVHDKVQLLWANHWDQVPLMLALVKRDAGFKRFIWPIIMAEDFPMDEFQQVLANAKNKCPRGAAEFCAAIKSAAGAP